MTYIVNELAQIVASTPNVAKRMRLAVTTVEYEEIRTHMLRVYGEFSATIMGVPLVVDEHASEPRVKTEFK